MLTRGCPCMSAPLGDSAAQPSTSARRAATAPTAIERPGWKRTRKGWKKRGSEKADVGETTRHVFSHSLGVLMKTYRVSVCVKKTRFRKKKT